MVVRLCGWGRWATDRLSAHCLRLCTAERDTRDWGCDGRCLVSAGAGPARPRSSSSSKCSPWHSIRYLTSDAWQIAWPSREKGVRRLWVHHLTSRSAVVPSLSSAFVLLACVRAFPRAPLPPVRPLARATRCAAAPAAPAMLWWASRNILYRKRHSEHSRVTPRIPRPTSRAGPVLCRAGSLAATAGGCKRRRRATAPGPGARVEPQMHTPRATFILLLSANRARTWLARTRLQA